MDRSLAMLLLLGVIVILGLVFLAFFAMAPIFWSLMALLFYILFIFLFNERHHVHNAQESENRFWTILAVCFSSILFFAKDSPFALGVWSPSLGFISVIICGYAMHVWDRYLHRIMMSKPLRLTKRNTATSSLNRLQDQGIPIKNILTQLNECLSDLDQTFIPSTINNWLNKQFVVHKEREIIGIFEEADATVLNYLICNSKLGLIMYKVKDHRSFKHQHRTKLIELLAIERISQLHVHSKVILLHSLQTLKLPANAKAEYCVRNIIMSTKQDELSELKTLMDSKGDYWTISKLIYDDIQSDIVRKDILEHIQRQAKVQLSHMAFKTRRSKDRKRKFWRKVLSDVDDTLTCSAGSYPSGIDKRYGKKVVYPGVIGFYRELDLGIDGPEEWPEHTVGNLVFLSARPHVYKDVTEKINHDKFALLRDKRGLHTTPCLLAGDLRSGVATLTKNDFGPLARKKFENFQQYVSIYPEFKHVFVCDNGQGDVKAGEMMVEAFPKQVEAIYVHEVQPRSKTYKYDLEAWKKLPIQPCFFKTYTEAALHAATRKSPLMRISGLRRICENAIADFYMIKTEQWPSLHHQWDRHDEINQSLCYCNDFLRANNEQQVPLLQIERLWKDGEKVSTQYGCGEILSFDPTFNSYEIELDWRPVDTQVEEYKENELKEMSVDTSTYTDFNSVQKTDGKHAKLETVFETEDEETETKSDIVSLTVEPTLDVDDNVNHCEDDKQKDDAPDLVEEDSVLKEGPTVNTEATFKIRAKIQCRFIKKYKPPTVPTFPTDDESKTAFSFWGTRSDSKALIKKDDKCSTPYGLGTVLEYRESSGIVVLSMSGWSATAYLNVESVKIVGEGFFNRMLRIISTETSKSTTAPKSPAKKEVFAVDAIVPTIFGEGKVVRSVRTKIDTSAASSSVPASPVTKQLPENTSEEKPEYDTMAISLSSWTMANGKHPTIYCTCETAQNWKTLHEEKSKNAGGILSAISQGVKKLISAKPKKKSEDVPNVISIPSFERYYKDGAAVVTPFGNGVVETFRSSDGMYLVSLRSWKMADGRYAQVYCMKNDLTYQIAAGCIEGYPVLTSMGISGTLLSVQPTTGVHVVADSSCGLVCYLQPRDVLRPLKASVNDIVLTQYGDGKLTRFRAKDDRYEIELSWGAKLYAQAESFDRDNSGDEVRGARFGVDWVFNLFFFADNNVRGGGGSQSNSQRGGSQQRSRSNSIASARTNTSRSLI